MGEVDISKLLIDGPKQLQPRIVAPTRRLSADSETTVITQFPYDADSKFIFYSKPGGFVAPGKAFDSVLTSTLHYGPGGFEGIRPYYTRNGTVFPELAHSIGRLLWTATAFDTTIQGSLIEKARNPNVERIEVKRRTPREFYHYVNESMKNGKEPVFEFDVLYKNGEIQHIEIPLRLRVMRGEAIFEFTAFHIEAIIKSIAYLNRVVSIDHFPSETLEMVMGAYFRPSFWVSGEDGLKVPTLVKNPDGQLRGKPLYFAVSTLPWGRYLPEEEYAKGLDIIVGPFPRIGNEMLPDRKVSGYYVNSAFNINLGLLFGFGEIFAMNREGRIIEGSAENVFIVYVVEGNGIDIHTPPISEGCLPGTTRDRMIRAIETKLGIEVTYKTRSFEEARMADAILLTGTGAQAIHARTICELKAAHDIATAMRLRGEDEQIAIHNVRPTGDIDKKKIPINAGKRHPIVDEIWRAYREYMLENNGKRLDPAHDIRPDALAEVLGVERKDLLRKGDDLASLSERVNGIENRDALQERIRLAAKIIKRGMNARKRMIRQKVRLAKTNGKCRMTVRT